MFYSNEVLFPCKAKVKLRPFVIVVKFTKRGSWSLKCGRLYCSLGTTLIKGSLVWIANDKNKEQKTVHPSFLEIRASVSLCVLSPLKASNYWDNALAPWLLTYPVRSSTTHNES